MKSLKPIFIILLMLVIFMPISAQGEFVDCWISPSGTFIDAEIGGYVGFDIPGSGTFTEENSQAGYLGRGYLTGHDGSGSTCATSTAGREYYVGFSSPGIYKVWIRAYAPSESSDSVFIGHRGNCVGALKAGGVNGQWIWTNSIKHGTNTIIAGDFTLQRLNIWIREPGYKIDGIYVTKGSEIPTDASHGHVCGASLCIPETSQPCGTGLLGVCAEGTETCNASGSWGACVQNVQASTEICNDDLDNDCDGNIDIADLDCPSEYPFEILRTAVPPDINGYLDEYDNAESITFSPLLGGNTVTIRALWDDDALYLAYDVSDTQLNGVVDIRDGDDIWLDDSVEWVIDTLNNDGGSGDLSLPYMLPDDYGGLVSILNIQLDQQGRPEEENPDWPYRSWNGNWQSEVQLNGTEGNNADTDTGYTVEVAIPWNEIGFFNPPSDNTTVGLGFQLNDSDDGAQNNSGMWPPGGETYLNAANWTQMLLSEDEVCLLPSRIAGIIPFYYYTVQDAYNLAFDGDMLQSQNVIIDGDLQINLDKSVTMEGGYSCDYLTNEGTTIIDGDMIISDGEITIAGGRVMVIDITPIPETGQTQSYTSTFGEDHDYTINPLSYSDNGNETVTDNVTGLMWQREDDNQFYNWYESSGTYDATDNPGTTDVCGSSTLAGYSDWRLPDRYELMNIVNYGEFGPAIDSTTFPNTNSSYYWSSTTYAHDPTNAWIVHFSDGVVSNRYKTNSYNVRCVRGGQ